MFNFAKKCVCVWGGDGGGDGGGGKPLGSDAFTMLTTSCTMQRAIYNWQKKRAITLYEELNCFKIFKKKEGKK